MKGLTPLQHNIVLPTNESQITLVVVYSKKKQKTVTATSLSIQETRQKPKTFEIKT